MPIAMLVLAAAKAHGDEGMWLFNNPPKKLLKEKYGFEPTRRVARARAEVVGAVQQRRLGLVRLVRRPGDDQPSRRRRRPAEAQHARTATTWRPASTPRRRDEEIKCVDLELNVLMSIEDVTERVNAAVKPGMPTRPTPKRPAAR